MTRAPSARPLCGVDRVMLSESAQRELEASSLRLSFDGHGAVILRPHDQGCSDHRETGS
jgi:hypothetical protein